ncbi:Zinc finger, PMZ-type [Corchorus olitorius]|uniref:Zinc finger, PMZ-type n=1 Tax=Corchorus olitorius TaxID=93759 RepID=A0A1R3HQN3_9ROSI|nr:Zinc finger, PMZ-type [Corchorus olitorius]
MDVLKSMDGAIRNYLIIQWDVRHWSLAFASDFSKCDVIDNTMCETFNGVIVEAREKPIITMLEEIRMYVMRMIVKNRQQALDWKTEYGPRILAKLDKNWKRVDNWEVDWDGGVAFEVYHDNIELNLRERFIVSLEGKTCSCRGWDVSGVPCHHAIAAILYCGKEPIDYLDIASRKMNSSRHINHSYILVGVQVFGARGMRGKESEYVITRPAGNVQKVTTVRKLKEDARKMRHDRAAWTSKVQEVLTQESYQP